ncbi:unnamed protein product [Tuber aestivum]|uniref:Uncharacterized protein n=1 Tax=Tuber aestivum TaxID=59557 RepID=A0A292Q2X8_9PEZI|nr:unnamed protein product [Tuber aestivum]
MFGYYVLTHTFSSSPNEKTIPRSHSCSTSGLSKALKDPTTGNPEPPEIACPVSVCPLVFKGEMGDGYLWRHLKRPGIHGRTGDEKAAWLNLHKIEHDRLVATRITRAQRRSQANKNKAKAQMSRAAELELRARNMGITEETLIAQKVKIWEGMCAAKRSGDSVGYDAWVLLDFYTSP